ncbi:hypothetical protein BpHYR1_051279 [Brachionus plicatilis]|uniref:Uncharacterized protein n=1 Tax=Brachionus plicatilis TaxID=10195 RepID=A0A3M7T8Z6_BRAPC|nr:hypothetical protein BpHYR1_051279 [Brachionus plicatilis]
MGRVRKLEFIDENIKSNDITLDKLREKLPDHQGYNNENTLLQNLAKDNCIRMLFCPKYHCELNPIEGL